MFQHPRGLFSVHPTIRRGSVLIVAVGPAIRGRASATIVPDATISALRAKAVTTVRSSSRGSTAHSMLQLKRHSQKKVPINYRTPLRRNTLRYPIYLAGEESHKSVIREHTNELRPR